MHSRADQPEDVLAHTKSNEQEITNSKQCGCLSCSSIFPADTVTDWVEEPVRGGREQVDRTAICPHCGDALLIGDDGKREITPSYIEAMRTNMFV